VSELSTRTIHEVHKGMNGIRTEFHDQEDHSKTVLRQISQLYIGTEKKHNILKQDMTDMNEDCTSAIAELNTSSPTLQARLVQLRAMDLPRRLDVRLCQPLPASLPPLTALIVAV
jgi:hypothetical protein